MKRTLYAYNVTRQSFLSLSITVADTPLARLRGLLGRVRLRSDEGIWVVPSRGIHTVGLVFPIDVLYLDAQFRVVHLVEHLGPLRIAPIRRNAASVMEMRAQTIHNSGTQVGDQLMICSPEEMYAYWTPPPDAAATYGPANKVAKVS